MRQIALGVTDPYRSLDAKGLGVPAVWQRFRTLDFDVLKREPGDIVCKERRHARGIIDEADNFSVGSPQPSIATTLVIRGRG